MRIIINAARATDTKWGKGNKHFLTIGGERLLDRVVRLAKHYSDDIIINGRSEQYQYPGTVLNLITTPDYPLAGWLNGAPAWSQGKTVILLGDVYYTEDAMYTICTTEVDEWLLCGRPGGSSYTGKNYAEPFAFILTPPAHAKFLRACVQAILSKERGEAERCIIWHVYRQLIDGPPNEHVIGRNFCTIDDMTDDIDYRHDYVRMKQRLTSDRA